jgi:hypothetical protein
MRSALVVVSGVKLAVVLVEEIPFKKAADRLLVQLTPRHPTLPIMLVAVTDRGFAAYAQFQTHRLLGLLQLEQLEFEDISLPLHPAIEADIPF